MVINTNLASQTAANNLNASQAMLSRSLARLSSGSKINNASDDPAAVAMSARFGAEISRLSAAQSNVSNAVSFAQTQDGYLSKIGKALDRMSEISVLAQDSTKTDADRSLYNAEFSQLSAYVTNAGTKDFNGVSLFSGAALNITLDSDGNTFSMAGLSLSTSAYTNATGASVDTAAHAAAALTSLKAAIQQLSADRAVVGASETRLSYTAEQLSVTNQNLSAANSSISDVDVATESAAYAKANILVQSGTAMLAQANQSPQAVLKLLQ